FKLKALKAAKFVVRSCTSKPNYVKLSIYAIFITASSKQCKFRFLLVAVRINTPLSIVAFHRGKVDKWSDFTTHNNKARSKAVAMRLMELLSITYIRYAISCSIILSVSYPSNTK
uniref:Uncharacterized protein n=1 Tax=Glossina austeni TaxID=7395 RepID=A0A1A9VV61_GLOAU